MNRKNQSLLPIDTPIPKVYHHGMHNYAVIVLKTEPNLKEKATQTAAKLGVSLSAVLNNELRRFTCEQSVDFELPEVPNLKTAARLAATKKKIVKGDYYRFKSNEESLSFLADQLRKDVQIGLDQIERGEYTDYSDKGLDILFNDIKKEGRRRIKKLK